MDGDLISNLKARAENTLKEFRDKKANTSESLQAPGQAVADQLEKDFEDFIQAFVAVLANAAPKS